jgi:hypothetical protein
MKMHDLIGDRGPLQRAVVSTCVLAAFVYSPMLKAKPLRAGVTYQGGETVDAPDYGVSILVPKGWTGILPAQSEFFILRQARGPATVLVYVDAIGIEELKRKISSPIPADQYVLRPSSKLKKTSLGWSMKYTITPPSDQFSGAEVLAIHRHQTALAFIELSPLSGPATADLQDVGSAAKGQESVAASVLKRLAKSARISKRAAMTQARQQKAQSEAGPNAWRSYMAGRHVIRYFTSSGYSEESHLWLCSNGHFLDSMKTGGYGGGASGASAGRSAGSWSATGQIHANGRLILRYSDGRQSTHDLSLSNRKLYIDGKQWMRDKNQRCN